ncbi:MAG: ABC transporter family substrate-binding protein [Pseudoclavibacter sp.]|nr:ABC transporter family substrate-binding protein [Pseudoclavibacter sp.]
MKTKRALAAGALVMTGALALSACSAPNRDPEIVAGSAITVAWNDPFFSYNANTTQGNASANANIIFAANDGFFGFDPTPEQIMNEQFGKVEKLSDDPLTVKYTIADEVTWSDGTPMDGSDLLLSWAALTTHRTSGKELPEEKYDDEGNVTNQEEIDRVAAEGVQWGTGAVKGQQLDLVSQTPKVEGKSITLVYDKPYVDWQYVFPEDDISIAAHAVAQLAFPDKFQDGAEAKAAITKALQDNDTAFLSEAANVYRKGFDFKTMPSDPLYLLSNGPYVVTDLQQDQHVTLTAREDYSWGPKPHYETVTVRFISDPQAQVQALQNGEVQIVQGQPTVDLLQQLQNTSGITWESGLEATHEHLDLQAANGGPFDPASYGGDAEKARLVRQAFLLTIPRQEIVDKLIVPLNAEATVRQSNVFLPGTEGYAASEKASGIAEYEQNVEKAKQLLAQAGVDKPKVRFLTAKTNPRRQQEKELIFQQAKAAGFEMIDASAEDWSTVLSSQPDKYDAALFAWVSTSLAVGESAANYIKGGTNNYYGWDNPQVDKLFTELDTETDPARQQEILIEAEKLVYQEAWSLPIFQHPSVVAWSDQVEGMKPGFLSPHYFWSIADWKPAAAAA